MNKRKIIRICTLIIVPILLSIIAVSYFNIYRNVNSAMTMAKEKASIDIMVIKYKIDYMFDICSSEYSYEEIVTSRSSSLFGLNQKFMILEVKGKIKAGSRLQNLQKLNDKYVVTLKLPDIIESYTNIISEKSQTKFLGKFELSEDKALADKNHKAIEEKVKNELFEKAKVNTTSIISELLNQMGIQSEIVTFKFT